jgi:hypothetical protein
MPAFSFRARRVPVPVGWLKEATPLGHNDFDGVDSCQACRIGTNG